jgi:carboxyl-terminal processing protease
VDIQHWPLSKAVRLIRGKKNTRVVLTLIPASDVSGTTTKTIALIRDEVKLEEQAAKGRVEPITDATGATQKLGVITLPEFYADIAGRRELGAEARRSVGDVRRILNDLKAQGVAGIVLDLRNNGGGLLTEAVEMAGLFIDSGPVVQVSDARGTQVLNDLDPDNVYRGPLIVLVNRLTASASEIVAGALQDYGRAVIVGDSKTHGKGTVQTLVNLRTSEPALGTLKVTTASFYRIAGGSTQLKGIIPDIVTPSILDSMEVGEEYLPHAMPWSVADRSLYRPATNVQDWIPVLRRQAGERRAKDPRFTAYTELVERLGENQRAREVSLTLEDRVALVQGEKELQKLIQDTDKSGGAKTNSPVNDLVLTESLHILSDLIALQPRPPTETAAEPAPPMAVTKPEEKVGVRLPLPE